MTLNLVDICAVKFPGQIEAGNIKFRKPYEDILFYEWKVDGIPQPLESDLLAEAAQWEKPIAMLGAFNIFVAFIEQFLDSTAQSKQYGSALSIATYANSTNVQWKAEADAFIAWRDAVFAYSINIQAQVQADQIPIPTLEEFEAGIPAMVWPS
ncbi:MAG: hypothetical protein WA324_27810 [Bryobacteraceae bacterium]